MAATPKRGPYTIDELIRFWRGMVDEAYSLSLLDRLGTGFSIDEGDDEASGLQPTGLEVFTQQMAQAKRVSEAVDRTCESMFILPWSGQTAEPASGLANATVELTFERDNRMDLTISFVAGTLVEEVQIDAGVGGGATVRTGRRYLLSETLTFVPGERGPKTVAAVAEKTGYGYNNPLPGTLSSIDQPGAGLQNDLASVVAGASSHRLQVSVDPDVVVPEHVGQYVEFTIGANAGEVRRVTAYAPASTAAPHGGEAIIGRVGVYRVSSVSGTFTLGEDVIQATSNSKGKFVVLSSGTIVLEQADSTFATALVVTGSKSGAVATIDFIVQTPDLTSEATTAGWRMLDWAVDLGFTVTNDASPDGGNTDVLDELAAERRIYRSPGEGDEEFRKRTATLPDTISPNAIRRAGNRILSPHGAAVVLREVESACFPGFYCDIDACDYDFDVRPADRYKLAMSYDSFRAYMLIGVPRMNLGEFGAFYDVGAYSAYDVGPWYAFYDGFPLTAAVIYRAIWQAVDERRAGGVGFDLVLDAEVCTP